MNPTALVHVADSIVSAVKVADHMSLKGLSKEVSGDFTCPTAIVLEIADQTGRKAPKITVLTIFPPSSFVCVNIVTGFYLIGKILQITLTSLCDQLENVNDLPYANMEAVQGF
jgi:hypothetical protein